MDVGGVDRVLSRYRQAIEVMSANLLELDSDPTSKLLDEAPLTGTTRERWAVARTGIGQLWEWFARFQQVLAKATELRGKWSALPPETLAELDRLLAGPSVELSADLVPLDRRGLLAPAQTTVTCTPDQLLDHMGQAFDQAKSVVTAVSAAWDRLLPRLDRAQQELAALGQLAASLGVTRPPELAGLDGSLDGVRRQLSGDPLTADDRALADVETQLAVARSSLGEMARLRDGFQTELANARAELDDLERAVTDARAAHDLVRVKIAVGALPAPPDPDATLRSRLDEISGQAGRSEWRAAGQGLSVWRRQVEEQRAEVARRAAAYTQPLAERDELRGRLGAFQAKANRLGLLESGPVADLYTRARDVLYTAPTDLAEAARLVAAYQRAVAGGGPFPVER